MSRRCSFCGEGRKTVDRLVVGHGGVAICGDCARLAVELSSEPEPAPDADLLLTGIGTLVTNDPRREGLLGLVEEAAVAVRHGAITWVGRERDLPARYRELPHLDCEGRSVAPGFVDAHRHLDRRSGESLSDTTERVVAALGSSLGQGTTTVELRTWQSVGAEDEITMLSAVQAAAATLPTDVVPAMSAGTDQFDRGPGYRRLIESVVIPSASTIASYLDVVVGGPLSGDDAHAVIETGRRHGMRPRVHVDQPEALDVALEARAVSVEGMAGLEDAAPAVSEAGMIVVSVPVATWTGGRPDPAAALWASGAVVALGTGCSGGNVPTMPMALAIAVHHGRLTPEQALWSGTRGGALALEEPEKGVLSLGAVADLVLLDVESPADITANPGTDPVSRVIKDGVLC